MLISGKVYYSFKKKFNYILLLSLFSGWGVLCFKLNKNFYNYFLNNLLGFYTYFIVFLKMKGMGFKFNIVKDVLVLRVGFSHKILYNLKKSTKLIFKNKQFLVISSRYLSVIRNLIFFFRRLNKQNVYKLKGIFFKGMFIKLKLSSKKVKF